MPRATMSTLITRLRLLTGDPSGAGALFTDDQYQDALDKTQIRHRQILLTPIRVTLSGFGESYTEYQGPATDWEENAVLYDANFAVISALGYTQNSLTGLFTFTLPRTPPVYASGQTYDLYRAAVDILEKWTSTLKLNYPFSNQGSTVGAARANLTAQFTQLLHLSDYYKGKMKPKTVSMVRDDIEPED